MTSRSSPPGALLPWPAEDLRLSLAACLGDPWFAESLFDCLPDVDLFVELRPVPPEALTSTACESTSAEVQARVVAARQVQVARNRRGAEGVANADLDLATLEKVAPLGPAEFRRIRCCLCVI